MNIKERRELAKKQFRQRKSDANRVLAKTVRLADEMIRRLEREMFAGHNFVDDPNGAEARSGYQSALVKDLANLARMAATLAKTKQQIDNTEAKLAAELTPEEEFDFAVQFVKDLPPDQRMRFFEKVK